MFFDDLPAASAVTSASMERARQADTTGERRVRPFEELHIEHQDGTVAHGPLWFEDPVEMAGSDDGRFAVAFEDYVCAPYCIGRFVVNLALLPLSIAVDLPGSMVCSDGIERRSRISWLPEPYDAEKCSGVVEPIDVLEVWTSGADDPAEPDVSDTDETAGEEVGE